MSFIKKPKYNLTPMKFARYATDVMEFRNDTGFEYSIVSELDGLALKRTGSPKLKIELLEELEDVSKRAAAIRVLGQMLGINQSIKADPESLNKYFENIEVYFNKRMIETGAKLEMFKDLDSSIVQNILKDGLNARRFALDDKYREVAIDMFDKLKYDINIYDVMANSLHFFEMFKAAVYAEKAINNTSKRLRITNKIVDKFHKEGLIPSLTVNKVESVYRGNLPKNLYTKVSRMASDIINIRFFDEKDIKVKLRKGDYEFDGRLERMPIEAETTNIQLSTYAGRRSFVEWFENRVIPDLKNGMTKNNEGVYNAEPSDNLMSNEFIRSLQIIIDEDRNTGTRYIKYTLPIKMTASKTLDEKIMFDTYAEHFRNLGETTYDGQSVTDLFYLYNLIVNGNNVNNDSLTRIFESNFNYVLDFSKIKSHLRFIGDLDYNENNDNYKYLDYINDNVLIASGIYSEITANELSNNTRKQLPIVRKLSKDSYGVVRPQFFRGSFDGTSYVYNNIPVDENIISKYINTIDVNNSLLKSGILFEQGEMLQKVSSNLISYKIKCE